MSNDTHATLHDRHLRRSRRDSTGAAAANVAFRSNHQDVQSFGKPASDGLRRIRRIHPDLDEAEVRLKFIESTYGKELADAVRHHLQQRETT